MTNHIEQMMKAAGVKPRFYMEVNVGDLDCNFQEVSEKTLKKLWENWGFHLQCSDYWMEDEEAESIPENFEDFKKSDFWDKKYPPFTPAKQLELIKLIGEIPLGFHYTQPYDIYALQVTQMAGFYGRFYVSKKSFEDLIAIVIFELLKVNKLDKAEVKRILEDD